jgi:hypothetical protein
MNNNIKKQFENAEKVERPEPLPLRRESAPAQPYPVKALGKILAGAVNGIVDNVQCPDGSVCLGGSGTGSPGPC